MVDNVTLLELEWKVELQKVNEETNENAAVIRIFALEGGWGLHCGAILPVFRARMLFARVKTFVLVAQVPYNGRAFVRVMATQRIEHLNTLVFHDNNGD